MTNAIAVTDSTLTGTVFSAAQVARWKGPYTSTATFVVNGTIPIGLNTFLRDSLKDSLSFVVATVSGAATTARAQLIEALFDPTSDKTAGTVRWVETVAGTVDNGHLKILLTSSR